MRRLTWMMIGAVLGAVAYHYWRESGGSLPEPLRESSQRFAEQGQKFVEQGRQLAEDSRELASQAVESVRSGGKEAAQKLKDRMQTDDLTDAARKVAEEARGPAEV